MRALRSARFSSLEIEDLVTCFSLLFGGFDSLMIVFKGEPTIEFVTKLAIELAGEPLPALLFPLPLPPFPLPLTRLLPRLRGGCGQRPPLSRRSLLVSSLLLLRYRLLPDFRRGFCREFFIILLNNDLPSRYLPIVPICD